MYTHVMLRQLARHESFQTIYPGIHDSHDRAAGDTAQMSHTKLCLSAGLLQALHDGVPDKLHNYYYNRIVNDVTPLIQLSEPMLSLEPHQTCNLIIDIDVVPMQPCTCDTPILACQIFGSRAQRRLQKEARGH